MHLKQRVKQADAFQPKAILTPCSAAAADLTRVLIAQGAARCWPGLCHNSMLGGSRRQGPQNFRLWLIRCSCGRIGMGCQIRHCWHVTTPQSQRYVRTSARHSLQCLPPQLQGCWLQKSHSSRLSTHVCELLISWYARRKDWCWSCLVMAGMAHGLHQTASQVPQRFL